MKYIRTKDRVCNYQDYLFSNAAKKIYHSLVVGNECEDIEILKQADTIEELCDEFVLAKNDYFEYTIFRLFTTAKSLKLESVKDKEAIANIYGAIWTEWGLKYVAKMNEKGELELL